MAALLNPSAFIKGMKGAGNVVQRVGCSPSTQSTLGFNHSTAKATHWWHTPVILDPRLKDEKFKVSQAWWLKTLNP